MREIELKWDNTELGFAHLSDRELLLRKLLFSLFAWGVVGRGIVLWKWLRFIPGVCQVVDYLGERLSQRFHGGASFESCQTVIEELYKHQVVSTLDYCAEHASSLDVSADVLSQMQKALRLSQMRDDVPFFVLKITSLLPVHVLEKVQLSGMENLNSLERVQVEKVWQSLENFCSQVVLANKKLLIDAEESWVQDVIDYQVERLMARFNQSDVCVFHTIQMYRQDRFEYLSSLILRAKKDGFLLGIKLVRGAYLEKERCRALNNHYPSPLHHSKYDTDQAFDRAARLCIAEDDIVELCLATHNESSCANVFSWINSSSSKREDTTSRHTVCFAQLLGMGDHMTYLLASRGCRVSKYIPYGPSHLMLPYLLRRAEENSAMQGHGKREYELLTQEYVRRKNMKRTS